MPDPEIACDESGYEGDKLIGTTTSVFAHAGVRLGGADAAGLLDELRARVRSPATEYKANHLLREKHRRVLEWVLAALAGHAHVFLAEKEFFVLRQLCATLLDDPGAARLLHRDGPAALGPRWRPFLVAANNVLRVKEYPETPFLPVPAGAAGDVGTLLARLAGTGDRIAALRASMPAEIPPADPLFPAIARAARYGDGPATIVHDQQRVFSPERIAQVVRLGGLRELRLVDSGGDPRIQLADILAGSARAIASEALAGRGDAVLMELLRPYADPGSVWGDERSWPGA